MTLNSVKLNQLLSFPELQKEAYYRYKAGDLAKAYDMYRDLLEIAMCEKQHKECKLMLLAIDYELNPDKYTRAEENELRKILKGIMLIFIFVLFFSGTSPRDEFYTIGFQNENETHYFSSNFCKNYTQLVELNLHKSTHYKNYSKTVYKLPKTQLIYIIN